MYGTLYAADGRSDEKCVKNVSRNKHRNCVTFNAMYTQTDRLSVSPDLRSKANRDTLIMRTNTTYTYIAS